MSISTPSPTYIIAMFGYDRDDLEYCKSIYETYFKETLPSHIHTMYVVMEEYQSTVPDLLLPSLSSTPSLLSVNGNLSDIYRTLFETIRDKYPTVKGVLKVDTRLLPSAKHIIQFLDSMGRECSAYKKCEIRYSSPMMYFAKSEDGTDFSRVEYPPEQLYREYNRWGADSNLKGSLDTMSVICSLPRKPTLFVKLDSGLGNQMFQIASAYGISRLYGMDMVALAYDITNPHRSDHHTYLTTIFQDVPYFQQNRITCANQYREPSELVWTRIDDILVNHGKGQQNVVMHGYYQTDQYFKAQRYAICRLFLRTEILGTVANKYPQVATEQAFFIHIRRGDFLINQRYWIDYDLYYTKAIEYILERHPDARFYVFSNDMSFCEYWYVLWDHRDRITFVQDLDDVESLHLMAMCHMGGICANSTFSWWGSYLNSNEKKLVIMPDKWYNYTYDTTGVYYDEVIKLDS